MKDNSCLQGVFNPIISFTFFPLQQSCQFLSSGTISSLDSPLSTRCLLSEVFPDPPGFYGSISPTLNKVQRELTIFSKDCYEVKADIFFKTYTL